MTTTSSNLYEFWVRFQGRKIKIEGLTYTIKVTEHTAYYPYKCQICVASAVPTSATKASAKYREEKAKLGDHFTIDLLCLDESLSQEVFAQLS